MGRALRADAGGLVYHVLNRANARLPLFEKDGDYEAFERVLAEAQQEYGTRVLAYCVMPNHWHLMLWPQRDRELSRFTGWLTLTHTQRWHAHRHSAGSGHLYQGRFKSFPIEADDHLLTVLRYVERNPLRAGLVRRAEDWRWSSLWRRECGTEAARALLADGPVPRPRRWAAWVNEALTAGELEAVRRCVARGQPYGSPAWVERTVATYGLQPAMRARGRPRKHPNIGS
jgi:putative transposase